MKLRRLDPGQPGSWKSVSLSTIASLVMATLALVTFGRPILVSWIGEAAAGNIQATVKRQVEETTNQQLAPVVSAMRVLLQGEISTIERDIARLEFRQQRGIDWATQDAVELVDKRAALAQRRQALAAFDTAKDQQ